MCMRLSMLLLQRIVCPIMWHDTVAKMLDTGSPGWVNVVCICLAAVDDVMT
jgi:hypothetical protein